MYYYSNRTKNQLRIRTILLIKWGGRNFEFVKCIGFVLKTELMTELGKSAFHTLMTAESSDISVLKMLLVSSIGLKKNGP